jgi:UDP-glucose 4-epimerase
MRALVTGAAGFIGSHLSEELLEAGHEVVGLDDLSTGCAHNLVHLLDHPGFEFLRGTILDRDLVDELTARTDRVFHLAAAVGVHTIVDDPLASLRTNLAGTESVLDAALRHDRRVLITSTSEIYGKNDTGALEETADRILGSPLKCRWSYASAKALDEMIAHTYWNTHGLRVVTVRPFNTVGPRQTGRYGMVVPRFVDQALAGEPLTISGDGDQSRCFLHVSDLVPALIGLLEHPRAYGEVFNLGGDQETTIGDLAALVLDLTGSSSPLMHVPCEELYGPGFEDMRRRIPDTTKAHRFIGFAPTMTVEQIVASVVAERIGSAPVRGRSSTPAEAPADATVGSPVTAVGPPADRAPVDGGPASARVHPNRRDLRSGYVPSNGRAPAPSGSWQSNGKSVR